MSRAPATEQATTRAAAALELLEGPRSEALQKLGDRVVQLVVVEEAPVTEAGENPPLGDLHAGLGLGLVARFTGTRGYDGYAVVRHCGAAAKDAAGLRPYQYSQFCELHTRWTDKLDVVIEVELFVAVLGASNYTHAQATRTQRLADFVGSTTRALE